jgi:oligoendopeptidase F
VLARGGLRSPYVNGTGKAGAEGVRWDLTLFAPSERMMKERLEAALADAESFPVRWPVESIASIEPAALAELLRELADLRAARMEGERWVLMLASTDAENPAVRDLQAWVDARLPRFDEALTHFELAWVEIGHERAETLAASPEVLRERHYLLSLRRFQPFFLSQAEERVLAAREATAHTAWESLHSRTLAAPTARFDDGEGEREWGLSELEAASRSSPQRDVRRRAADVVEHLLAPVLPLLAQCYDSLVADHLAVDAVRGHTGPMERRNLENEIAPEVVEQLLAACEAHHDLARRWFEVKARLLGLERLDTLDFFAPALDAPVIDWDDGHRLAVDVFANLSPTLAGHAEAFFADRRIDAEPRVGKRFGGFCSWPSTRSTGFLYLNWTGSLLDLVMLTHELGHGTHFAIAAAAQSDNSFTPGLTIVEVPSTFAHLRLVEDQLAADTTLSRPLLAKVLDTAMLYVFVRGALTRYEQNAYALRARGETLTAERLSELCDAELAKVWGDAMTDAHGARRTTWAPMPHMVHARFYLYAYAFAFLLAAGLLARSRQPDFAERYLRFLAAGGSASPSELMRMVGVDLSHPGIWDEGFAVIEGWIDRLAS